MYLRRGLPLTILLFLLAGCARFGSEPPAPMTDNPTASGQGTDLPADRTSSPGMGDDALTRGEVLIDSLVILRQESFPPTYQLQIKGSLPTPCHQLRTAVSQPTSENDIFVEVYSVVDPQKVCSQVLQPFDASVSLGAYVRGSYAVFVNGQDVGQITP